jgi:hypothetical protein
VVTELLNLLVFAQIIAMITVLQSVQTVLKNVKHVNLCQITVSIVLQEESTHQHVESQNHPQNQLRLKMSQWLLPKLSTVLADVNLVKQLKITVLLVVIKEVLLQSVLVLLDIMKTITVPVKTVHTNVSLVFPLIIVMFVKTIKDVAHQSVIVLTDFSIQVLLTANHVTRNVSPVKTILKEKIIIVSLVNHLENKIHLIVIVLKDKSLMKTMSVEIVDINVKLVKETLTIVVSVKI